MSQKEMEALDQEVIRVANREPEIATSPVAPRNDKEGCVGKYEDAASAEKMRKVLWTVIKVLICILIGALFVAAMVDPRFVKHLANLGVLVCGMVASITIDRFLRRA